VHAQHRARAISRPVYNREFVLQLGEPRRNTPHIEGYNDMSETTVRKQRPKFLALHEIRLPLPGIVSILHRVSGAGLFLLLPFLLFLFDRSLGSPETFAVYKSVVSNWFIKLVLFGLLWAYLHHFCAGIRFLLLDLHIGGELEAARKSSRVVLIVSIALTLIIGVMLW
jgi:succinate dehydrogenase / fumarate reductase cytochrome b subunit